MNLLNHSFRITAVAAAFAAQAASAAAPVPPTTVLYGGGATFPTEAYVGPTYLQTLGNPRRLSQTPGVPGPVSPDTSAVAVTDKASLFGAFAGLNSTIGVSYCQTGSGAGKRTLGGATSAGGSGNPPAGVVFAGNGRCFDYAAGAAPEGFSGNAADPDFAGTDSPYSQSEINTFLANKGAAHGQPVQIPSTAGSIALVYNNPSLGKKKLNLTRSDVCGIAAGTITNWNQLTHTPKVTISSKPIVFVYRSDNSGTSFSFLNFLSAACPNLALPGDTATASGRFKMTETYSTAGAPLPAGAIGASGNGGIVTTVAQNDGAIGYADIANGLARAKIAGGSITYATVSYAADQLKLALSIGPGLTASCPAGTIGKLKDENDPNAAVVGNPAYPTLEAITMVKNPSTTKTLKFSCPAITYNKLDPSKNLVPKGATNITVTADPGMVLSTVGANGRVTLVAATGLPAGTKNCLQTVDPLDYSQPLPLATKKALLDFDRYPIVAVTYLAAYNTGNGAKAAAIKSLLKAPYDTAVLAKTKSIGKTSGFQPLVLKALASTTPTFVADTASAIVDACIN